MDIFSTFRIPPVFTEALLKQFDVSPTNKGNVVRFITEVLEKLKKQIRECGCSTVGRSLIAG